MLKSINITIPLLLSLCIGLLIPQATPIFTPTAQIPNTPQNPTTILYSPDLSYLLLTTDTKVTILNGHTYGLVQEIDVTEIQVIGTVSICAWNQDSKLLAVGSKGGAVGLWEWKEEEVKFVWTGKSYKSTLESTVESLCFSKDGSYLVIGIKQNQLTVWLPQQDQHFTRSFFDQYIFSLACSPQDNQIFVVGGGSNTAGKLTFFEFTGNQTRVLYDMGGLNQYAIGGVAYAGDGNGVYFAYVRNEINFVDLEDGYRVRTVYGMPGQALVGLGVAPDQKFLTIICKDILRILDKTGQTFVQTQTFPLQSSSYSLSQQGGKLFFISSASPTTGQVYSLCFSGQYYDIYTSSCVPCVQGCICDLRVDFCWSCAQKYFLKENNCLKCSVGCVKCTSESQCQECGEGFEPFAGFCQCKAGYFLRDETCVKCAPGCLTCVDQNSCTQCKPNFQLIQGKCTCPKGTYQDGQTCQPCPRGCLECTDANTCYSCDLTKHYILNDDNKCLCDENEHFVDNGTDCNCAQHYYEEDDSCEVCPTGCKTCTSQTECLSCYEGLIVKDGLCKCVNADQYLNPDNTCHKCSETLPFCASCDNGQVCKACRQTFQLVDNKCNCPRGTYLSEQTCKPCTRGCLECSDINTCFTCDFAKHYILNDDNKCMCNGEEHFVDNGTDCNCAEHYYLDEDSCEACAIGCKTCSSETECQVCYEGLQLKDGQCKCVNSDQYLNPDNTCHKCSETLPACILCENGQECKACKQGFSLVDGKCTCPKGTYNDGQSCKPCSRGCLDCTNAETCYACDFEHHYILNDDNKCLCDGNEHFVDNGTDCNCAEHYYEEDDTCQQCLKGCKICTSQTQCQECYGDLQLKDGVCKCPSPDQYLTPDNTCRKCSDTLQYCIQCDNPEECKDCQPGTNRQVRNGKCLCKSGFFDIDGICQPCTITGCLQCLSPTECKTCDSASFFEPDPQTHQCKCLRNYTLYQTSCIKCAIGCAHCDPSECIDCDQYNHWVPDEVGQCRCEQGFYQDGEICKGCMVGCLECVRGEYCDVCDQGKHFQGKSGICMCETGFYLDNTTCKTCSVLPHCLQCTDPQTCILCAKTYTLNTTSHKCFCPSGTYDDKTQCSSCSAHCLSCTNATSCTVCEKDYVLKKGVCEKNQHIKRMVWIIVGVMALAALVFGLLR